MMAEFRMPQPTWWWVCLLFGGLWAGNTLADDIPAMILTMAFVCYLPFVLFLGGKVKKGGVGLH